MVYSVWTSPIEMANNAAKSYGEILESLSLESESGYCYTKSQWNECTKGSSFLGVGGTKKVVENLLQPHEYEAKITADMEKSMMINEFFRKRFKFVPRSMVGQRVDVARYLSGDQRCWFTMKRLPVKNSAIRVFAPIGGTGEVSRKEMSVCGALSCAVTDILESNGISVELWAACCATRCLKNGETNDICTLIKLKDSGQYCDYGFINYVTGDSYFYRNIVFKDRIYAYLKSGLGSKMKSVGGSYNFNKSMIPEDESYQRELDVVIPRIYRMEEAQKWLNELINGSHGNAIMESRFSAESEHG